MRWLLIIATIIFLCIAAVPVHAYQMYINAYSGSNYALYTFDTDTGTSSQVGSTGVYNLALSFDADGNLFGINNRVLYSIDTATGATTAVGSGIGNSGYIEAATFDFSNTLIGADSGSFGNYYTVNTTTGAGTSLGALSPGFDADGLTVAPVDVVVSGLGTVSAGTIFGIDSGSLYTVDLSTMSSTLIGSVGANETITFAPDGTLYGIARSVNIINLSDLSSTFVGNAPGTQAYGSAIAGLVGEPIPEPATMLLLGSGLVGLAGFRRKLKK